MEVCLDILVLIPNGYYTCDFRKLFKIWKTEVIDDVIIGFMGFCQALLAEIEGREIFL